MSTSERLWRENRDLAEQALQHPFVRGIADGTLPEQAFAAYIAQDAYFLESFARGYALAVAHSRDRPTLDAFGTLLAGVLEELRLHARYAEQLGIDQASVRPRDATSAYTDFLLATAATGGIADVCAAMTPCMRLYAHLGGSLRGATATPYTDWIDTYADPEFAELAATLEGLLDEHADSDDPALSDLYRRAMRLEVAFFDAAWAGAGET